MSGQYAELVARANLATRDSTGMNRSDLMRLIGEAASALTTLTQQQLPFNLTHTQIEEYRRENIVNMEPPLPDWAVEENRVLNAICDIAAGKLIAWKAMGDSALPIVNGGASTTGSGMSDDQIKYMVDRFLGWKLPERFKPDSGISFTAHALPHLWPTGTNLFDADQAKAMIRYLVDGMPEGSMRLAAQIGNAREVLDSIRALLRGERHPDDAERIVEMVNGFLGSVHV